MNNQLAIHAGIELLAIGGLAAYIKTSTSSLQKQLDEQKQINEDLKNALRKHGSLLERHNQILERIVGGNIYNDIDSKPANEQKTQVKEEEDTNVTVIDDTESTEEADNILAQELLNIKKKKKDKKKKVSKNLKKEKNSIEINVNGPD